MTKGSSACPHCGVTDKAQTEFNKACGDVDLLLKNPKSTIDQLKNALAKLTAVVPSFNRVASSETAKKVGFYTEQINVKEKANQASLKLFMDGVSEIDKQIASKKFKQAEILLNDLRRKVPGFNDVELNKYAEKIAGEIAKADAFTKTAKSYMASNNMSLAMENAAKALEICSDNADAQQILKKSPPKAPTSITLKTKEEKSVLIEWTIPQDQKLCTYTVVRKVGVKPSSLSDGQIIKKDLTLNFFEDTSIVPATPYFYGVFAERYGVQSGMTTSLDGVKIFPDVLEPKQDMAEGKIKIDWVCPSGVTEVIVKKNKGTTLTTLENGQTISSAKTGFIDTDCDESGCSYFVTCVYDMQGQKKYSKGVNLFYKPFYIPKSVVGLKISRIEKGEYAIFGENLTRNTKLYFVKDKIDVKLNKAEKIEYLAPLSSKASVLAIEVDQNGSLFFRVPIGNSGYIYAVNQNEQLFTANEPFLVTTATGINNVKYTERSGELNITFNVESPLTQLKVKVSRVAFAKNLDDDGDVYTFAGEQVNRTKAVFLFAWQTFEISSF